METTFLTLAYMVTTHCIQPTSQPQEIYKQLQTDSSGMSFYISTYLSLAYMHSRGRVIGCRYVCMSVCLSTLHFQLSRLVYVLVATFGSEIKASMNTQVRAYFEVSSSHMYIAIIIAMTLITREHYQTDRQILCISC